MKILIVVALGFSFYASVGLSQCSGYQFSSVTLIDPLCNGDSTGSIAVQTTGATGLETFSLVGSSFAIDNFGFTSNLPDGVYVVNIEDQIGCILEDTFTLYNPPLLGFTELGSEPAYCRTLGSQSGYGVVYMSASGGTPDYDYEWKNLGTGQTTNNTTWGGRNPGTYEAKVTDGNGCILIQTIELDSINPIAAFDIVSSDFTLQGGTWIGFDPYPSMQLINSSTGYSNPNNPWSDTIFHWDWDYGSTNPVYVSNDFYEPIYKSYDQGNYSLCLITFNTNGCADTACIEIFVFEPAGVDENLDQGFFTLNVMSNEQSLAYNLVGSNSTMLRIFDLQGKLVKEVELIDGAGNIPFHENSGMYIYEVFDLKSKSIIINGKFIY